jgi:hypothetical protein
MPLSLSYGKEHRHAIKNHLKVMIASPGDVAKARQLARDVIHEWNAVNSDDRKKVLMPIGWDTHSSPEMGDRPQAIINKQVLAGADLLIAIFWTRLGSPTGKAASGTAIRRRHSCFRATRARSAPRSGDRPAAILSRRFSACAQAPGQDLLREDGQRHTPVHRCAPQGAIAIPLGQAQDAHQAAFCLADGPMVR